MGKNMVKFNPVEPPKTHVLNKCLLLYVPEVLKLFILQINSNTNIVATGNRYGQHDKKSHSENKNHEKKLPREQTFCCSK